MAAGRKKWAGPKAAGNWREYNTPMTVRLRSPISAFSRVLLYEILAALVAFWGLVGFGIVMFKLGY